VWLNNTVNLDTGCVYGGHLSALRYPERETVSVPAQAVYYPSRKRFLPNRTLAARAIAATD
jgi:protein phosphatase